MSNAGGNQTVVGQTAGSNNTGHYQTVIGFGAGTSNTGANQSVLGANAGQSNTGSDVSAIGVYAAHQNKGNNVTTLGYRSAYQNTGDNLIALGYQAGQLNTGNNLVALGYRAGSQNTLANQFIVQQSNVNTTPLIQGNFATGNVGIGTTNPQQKLDVAGNIVASGTVTAAAPTANGHLTTKQYVDARVAAGTGFVEQDPKVGGITNGRWCYATGSKIVCDRVAPVLTEVDPKVGTLTNGRWCRASGGKVVCDQNAPSGGGIGETVPASTSCTINWSSQGCSGRIGSTQNFTVTLYPRPAPSPGPDFFYIPPDTGVRVIDGKIGLTYSGVAQLGHQYWSYGSCTRDYTGSWGSCNCSCLYYYDD